MSEIIRNVAAWFTTDEAVEWVKLTNPEGEILLRRVAGLGVAFTAAHGTSHVSLGLPSGDLVKLGRYLLAVAAAEGQNINEGFTPPESGR
jgi:hypothetical protein